MQLYPAIDIREGRIVRLHQGDYARQLDYPATPLEQMAAYARDGAEFLHLVDLDAARRGRYTLLPLLEEIRKTSQLRVQTGGGIRTAADVATVLDAGASRVVVGSVAVTQPETVRQWLREFGAERIVIALDTRKDAQGQWQLPTHGWTVSGERTLEQLLDFYRDAHARHILCTDIDRDGMLQGPNVELYRCMAKRYPELAIQASGGVSRLDDIREARDAGCAGIVLGRALLEGRFDVTQAVEENRRHA